MVRKMLIFDWKKKCGSSGSTLWQINRNIVSKISMELYYKQMNLLME